MKPLTRPPGRVQRIDEAQPLVEGRPGDDPHELSLVS